MAILEQKFDEVKVSGQLLPSALNSAITNSDEIDNAGQIRTASRLVKRTVSSNLRKPQTLDVQSKSQHHFNKISTEKKIDSNYKLSISHSFCANN